jgi:tetratricopeptide (TPR) repeat protein
MIVLAAAFGTFVLFLFFGLLALPVTAVLDKSIGKEKGLLIYAAILLAFTFFVLRPEGPGKRVPKPGKEDVVEASEVVRSGDPFTRPDPNHDLERNVFQPFSDTQPLPPVTLDTPPWIPLDFSLPPTVPGPAPGVRHVFRGSLPKVTAGDGTTIAPIPDAVFVDYEVKPEDVYDWVKEGGQPFYVYILAIDEGNGWVEEGEKGFEALKWRLADPDSEDYDKLRVNAAFLGARATKMLGELDVLKAKRIQRSEHSAKDKDRWFLRRTVDNLFAESLRRHGIPSNFHDVRVDPAKLRNAAREMADVGRTGKESQAGWKRAVELLTVALDQVRELSGPAVVSDYLLALLEAERALRDESAELRTLAEYVRAAPTAADAPTWLGDLHLNGMNLPGEALRYYRAALSRNNRFVPALIGQGDALAHTGDHDASLRSYRLAAGEEEGVLRRGVAELRLGKAEAARGTAESVLSREPASEAALLLRGAALYAAGDLESARGAFEQLASAPDANKVRAQACYNLGLTCLRLGQRDAAMAAFDACEKALLQGSSWGPTPDERVSPSLGRALVAFAEGNEGALRGHIDRARQEEAPRSSYVEHFAGMVASLSADDASAVRALDSALRRAPAYGELDGWLGKTYSRLGEGALRTGATPKDTAETFERAIAFAERAANREVRRDKTAFRARLRECLVRISAGHLAKKKRYGDALAAAEQVLAVDTLREQPAALALSGYCNFQIGEYDECIRKLQQVLDVVPVDDEGEWKLWRDYAENALQAVKHWRSLEEKVVSFKSPTLDSQWGREEGAGVTLQVDTEEGRVYFRGEARRDGRIDSPIIGLDNDDLFKRETFEQISFTLRIPRTDRRGDAINNVTFGASVEARGKSRGTRRAKTPGVAVFYDKAKIAVRIGGGQEKRYKDGSLLRLDPERLWPDETEVRVRIVREDAKKGTMAVYLNDELVIRDNISGFKQSRGNAAFWVGGYSTETEPFDVSVGDIRVIRTKKTGR